MSFKQKTWKDRISEHPTRRTLTDVSNNTTKTVDVAREEGTISQEGDAYSAANMNDLEQRVADGFSTLSQDSVKIATKNTTSDSIAFGIDSNGNYGYIKEGADTVTPFKSQKDIDNAYNSGVSAADARVNTSSASYNSGYTNGYRSKKLMLLSSGTIHGGDSNAASPTYKTQTYKFNKNYDQVIVVCNSCRDIKDDYGEMTMSYSGSGSIQVLSDDKISKFSSATRVIIRQITNVSANDSIILGMNDINHWGCFAILG